MPKRVNPRVEKQKETIARAYALEEAINTGEAKEIQEEQEQVTPQPETKEIELPVLPLVEKSPTEVNLFEENNIPKNQNTLNNFLTQDNSKVYILRHHKMAKFTIPASRAWDHTIIDDTPGIIRAFYVATNSKHIRVQCNIRDLKLELYELSNKTMEQYALLGMGLTYGEAEATSPNSTSLDKSGMPDPVFPYLKRYKSTPTGTTTDYESYKGTIHDEWYVLAYTPVQPLVYEQLEFSLINEHSAERMVHEISLVLLKPYDVDLIRKQGNTFTNTNINTAIGPQINLPSLENMTDTEDKNEDSDGIIPMY